MIRQLSRTCLPLLLLAQASLLACATDSSRRREALEAEVREKALFLCQHGLVEQPVLSRLPSEARPGDYIRQEDLFFLMDTPGAVPRQPGVAPGTLSCEAEFVSTYPDAVVVHLRRTDALGPTPRTDKPVMTFVRDSQGWRATYWLPERAPASSDAGARDVAPSAPFTEGAMTAPVWLSGPELEYSREALENRVEGLLVIKCVITRAGAVTQCRVLKPLPYMTEAALRVLTSSRYKPVMYRGEPVQVDYTFNFRLHLPR